MEIGGYLELEKFEGQEFYSNLVAVNTGRNALLYILKARNIKKLYIPYFLCDCVSKMCERYGYSYEYYHISDDFHPIFEKRLSEQEFLYVVNYYGQLSNEIILAMKEKYRNIIVDNVQAFFQTPVKGIDTIYSCRKYFGVPDGAYVSTDAEMYEELKIDISNQRMQHVLGRFEECASDYYDVFQKNDIYFEQLELKRMSLLTQNILKVIDYDNVCKKRENNYMILENMLGELNGIKFTKPVGPYMYPFYTNNGMDLKRKLAKKKIYVATLWPNVMGTKCVFEKDLAENILPLPCDQRYDEKTIKYMANYVLDLLK